MESEIMDANKIKKLRLSLGLTQTEFGDQLNVTRITITRWENGSRAPSPLNQYELEKLIKKHKNKA